MESLFTLMRSTRDPEVSRADVVPTAQPLWRLHNHRQTALRNLKREDDVIHKMARAEHFKQAQRSLDEAAKAHADQIKNQARERTHRTLTEISEKVKRDPHAAYRSLKHVAPWSPAPRVCLRSPCGRILTESEGLAELKRHSLSIFSSHPPLASGLAQAGQKQSVKRHSLYKAGKGSTTRLCPSINVSPLRFNCGK